jgi:vacuolar-type H+-ATPase subunit I/STV1
LTNSSLASGDDDSSLVDRIRQKRPGMATLEAIVDRLDEREVAAKGLDHVEFKLVGGDTAETSNVEFERVHQPNQQDQAELERLEGRIDQLLEAVAVLDEEFRATKQSKGESYVAHAEAEHWGGGKCAHHLTSRVREIRRERSDQFQKRMEEFREAQRRKDDDDHKFKGYTDLGTLN